MKDLSGKRALVVGASSGSGRATAKLLASAGVEVVAVARGAEGLASLRAEAGDRVRTVAADATDPKVAERLVREVRPDFLVLALGVVPRMAPFDTMSWEQLSEAWNVDTQATFWFLKAALGAPLPKGSTVVVVSSGAAVSGSWLSGGYAGAKRMQWFLASYAQRESDDRKLDIRVVAVVPKQLVEGTATGELASRTYGATMGKSAAEYMARWERPLRAEGVAESIAGVLRGEVASGVTAIGVTAAGSEPLP
jgi:3-oxoacyl-[acyl-carrier protein] reductase